MSSASLCSSGTDEEWVWKSFSVGVTGNNVTLPPGRRTLRNTAELGWGQQNDKILEQAKDRVQIKKQKYTYMNESAYGNWGYCDSYEIDDNINPKMLWQLGTMWIQWIQYEMPFAIRFNAKCKKREIDFSCLLPCMSQNRTW